MLRMSLETKEGKLIMKTLKCKYQFDHVKSLMSWWSSGVEVTKLRVIRNAGPSTHPSEFTGSKVTRTRNFYWDKSLTSKTKTSFCHKKTADQTKRDRTTVSS